MSFNNTSYNDSGTYQAWEQANGGVVAEWAQMVGNADRESQMEAITNVDGDSARYGFGRLDEDLFG